LRTCISTAEVYAIEQHPALASVTFREARKPGKLRSVVVVEEDGNAADLSEVLSNDEPAESASEGIEKLHKRLEEAQARATTRHF
jgi:hypothetical protein